MVPAMIDLATAIGTCLALHAKAVEKLGTEFPEQLESIPDELRQKMRQARANVNATLAGSDPTQHVLHLQALNKGLRIVLRRLLPPAAPEPPAPPPPVWNDKTKSWEGSVTDSKTRITELAEAFDRRVPDDPRDLFRDGTSERSKS
jgi:hypothetical protein